jgi:NADPH-dependent curcumin reductase CurA
LVENCDAPVGQIIFQIAQKVGFHVVRECENEERKQIENEARG